MITIRNRADYPERDRPGHNVVCSCGSFNFYGRPLQLLSVTSKSNFRYCLFITGTKSLEIIASTYTNVVVALVFVCKW